MPSVGPTELIIVLVIVLVIFGPKKLPGLGRSLGTGMREFKDSITGGSKDDDDRSLEASEDAPVTAKPEDAPVTAKPEDAPVTAKQHDDSISRPRG